MSWVGLVGFLDACRAVVEVRAIHALMADAKDVLVLSAFMIKNVSKNVPRRSHRR